MSIEHTDRRGRQWYLHAKTTAAGNPSYFFSRDEDGGEVPTLPAGYEVYESVVGQVFLRKTAALAILHGELALVESALRKHGGPWQFRAEAKKKWIVIHEAGNLDGLAETWRECRGRPMSESEMLRHACYQAVMRFTLADKKTRSFTVERYCFRGSVDDWIPIGGPGGLAALVRQFVKHLGRASFFELF